MEENYYRKLMRMEKEAKKNESGAPTRATILPTDAAERKKYPVASGLLDYFPDALAAVANLSWKGNEQHNPGQPLHWDRSKSTDEADTMMRHFLQRGTLDTDGIRHSVKVAWRALALLQKELEEEMAKQPGPEPGAPPACPYDTDGDGNCGRQFCQFCGGTSKQPAKVLSFKPGEKLEELKGLAHGLGQKMPDIPTYNGVPLVRWRCTRKWLGEPCRRLNSSGHGTCGLCLGEFSMLAAEAA